MPDATIYVLQGIGEDSINVFNKYVNMIPVISSPEMLEYWKENAIENVKPAIQVETGLNRLGFREKELQELSSDDLKIFGLIMSHLACADEKNHFMNTHQIETFSKIKNLYFPNIPASLSASDGVFLGSEFGFDMVRLGIGIYGVSALPDVKLSPVASFKCKILQVKTLQPGDGTIGYGRHGKISPQGTVIATIPVGYADGLDRHLSRGAASFSLNGHRVPTIGNICMDMTMLDITGVDAEVGDTVTIFGEDPTISELASILGTIPYEILTSVPRRIERVIVK